MNPPFEHYFDLSALSSAGQDVRVVAKRDDLERIAQWADVQSIGRFEALISLRKLSQSRKIFDRELHLVSHVPRGLAPHGEYPVSQTEEEPPEDIESARYDLAAPLLEELVLALDPYPRALGVVFESPIAGELEPESPFAVLKALKGKE
jgi:hypothetical protein